MGQCVDACGGAWAAGGYGYCLDQYGSFDPQGLCGASHACIVDADPINVATCSRQGCSDVCDCPAPPATGNAVVTCVALPADDDMLPDCYLSCANGETCPDGMTCQDGTYCANPVQPLPMYGNCDDVAAPCIDGTCAMSNGHSVCVTLCPAGIGDCDPAPPGADLGAVCAAAITPPMGTDCFLDCNGPGDCPSGMSCVNGTVGMLCMWP
jgi:hypothetical protein